MAAMGDVARHPVREYRKVWVMGRGAAVLRGIIGAILAVGLGNMIFALASRISTDDATLVLLLVAAVAGFSFASRKERA